VGNRYRVFLGREIHAPVNEFRMGGVRRQVSKGWFFAWDMATWTRITQLLHDPDMVMDASPPMFPTIFNRIHHCGPCAT
jgi:hypothetical protein